MSLADKLRQPLTMSMFASTGDLYREQEAQRSAAADEIRNLKHTIATQARTIAALRERLGEDHA